MNRALPVLLLVCVLAITPAKAGGTNSPSGAITNRPSIWAQPVYIWGISNSFRVSANLYRGAQPSAEGMRSLEALGVKSVINLRSYHSDTDKLAGTTLKSFRFTEKPWHAEEEDVIQFLKIVSDTNNLPAFIHCQRGADRTGTMCAVYRLAICGWTKDEAIAELKDGGFHFAPIWKNLVKFIQQTDVPAIRLQAGLTNNPTAAK